MRRTLVSLILAALVAISAVTPAGAARPSPTPDPTPAPTPSTEPAPTPPPEPTPEPSPEPTPAATPEPSVDPTAEPSTEPEPSPTVDPSPSLEPSPEAAPGAPADSLDIEDRYIVVLASGADVPEVAQRHRDRNGVRADRQFLRAFRGFSAKLDARQRTALDADPNVVAIVPDERIELTAQSTPTGVARVGARSSTVADIDGVDQRVDADVAIVDTGVGPHIDLNIAGGYNCASSDRSAWRDKEGHGTHVAGTVAALDNSYGVVGVAPGARIWGVRILNDDGEGLLSWYVCGLDWILAQRDPDDPSRPLIEAVNMSVAKWGRDDADCGYTNNDILHRAICRLWDGGITVVAAAANDSGSAALRVPAAYNEVITVSALADSDGKAGGDGGNGCYSWGSYDSDDTFANFSNYGYDVDIIAPGKCINSTKINNTYGLSSGTSMAAPAVTGAVALYKSTRPLATPKEVREALVYLGNFGWSTSTDPDDTPDKLLDVSRLGKLGTFAFDAAAPTATVTSGGGSVAVPIGITRSATFFETVRFIVDSQPSGWSTTWSPDRITGWTANSTNLIVSVPSGTLPGSYEIRIRASNQGRMSTSSVLVVVGSGARWHAVTPTRVLDTRIGLGMSGRLLDGVPRVFRVTGTAVPSDATAVTGNLTITGPTGPGYVSIGATMTSKPSTSTINVRAGQTLANGVTVRIGPGGNVGIVYDSLAGRTAHAVFDITGYYRNGSGGSTWSPIAATRLLDTRVGNGLSGPFTNRTVRTFELAGRGSVPSGAVAVTGNLTVVGQTSAGYVSIGPSMTSSPSTSTINVVAGVALANNVTLRIGSGGRVGAVFVGTSGARTDLVLDITGYYLSGSGGAAWFPVNANRVVDTRIDRGIDGRLADGVVESVDIEGVAVPAGTVAVVGNLTLTSPTSGGYSTVASSLTGTPSTSSINVRAGDTLANGVTFRLASDGSAKVVFQGASGSSTHAIIDIVGYFR